MSRRILSEAVHTGRNAEHVKLRDDRYVRCSHCGFICHLDRDRREPDGSRAGSGVEIHYGSWGSGAWGDMPWGGGGDPQVKSGCPFCGSLKYDK